MATVYTLEQVEKHNTNSDCWFIVHNKVYNITEFAMEHPGGEDILFSEAGKDVTEAFEDIGHSTDARDIMEKYYVGELEESAHTNHKKYHGLQAGELPEESKGLSLSIILPTLAVIGALVYKFVLASERR
ncbi:cytochrome b5 [Spinellus fusiger]|nr:cytochrome b5 [Spinellus fusiger]